MHLRSLGYVGVRASELADWRDYGTNLLGMQLIDDTAASLAFRMDDRKQRLVVSREDGPPASFYGWEVENAAAMQAVAARLERAGVPVSPGTRALADERFVADLIVTRDPAGNRLEIFHGPEIATASFRPGRSISGFRTGPLGMGHAVLTVTNVDETVAFYVDVLGFRLSDFCLSPFKAYFFHLNERHHSLAIIESSLNGIHHLMVELYSFDDVGQGYDLALNDPERLIGTTLGRHTNDFMTSFYSRTPSKFMVEYGWGGRSIEPDTWEPFELKHGPSMWGHERAWATPEVRAEARQMRERAAREGVRQPVQVIEGNFQIGKGFCPWWDANVRRD